MDRRDRVCSRAVLRTSLLVVVLTAVCPLAAAAAAEDLAAASPPTVRVWATREGLVGKTTASGHVIEPNDHFVALSSRSALGKTVVVTYKGKSIQAPVMDVGP